jgi:hypothetical protein
MGQCSFLQCNAGLPGHKWGQISRSESVCILFEWCGIGAFHPSILPLTGRRSNGMDLELPAGLFMEGFHCHALSTAKRL